MRCSLAVCVIACALASSAYCSEPCTDTIYASVLADTVNVFHDGAFYNCCAAIDFDLEIGDTTIDVVERETFPQGPCNCMCCFDLSLSIAGVPPGVYWVCVWNEDKSLLYGRVQVTVRALPSGPPDVSDAWQSECYTLVPGTDHGTLFGTLALGKPMPNPTSGETQISYELGKAGHVSLRVYDSSGRIASVLVEGVQSAGSYTFMWNGRRFPAGVYFVRLSCHTEVSVRKLLLTK